MEQICKGCLKPATEHYCPACRRSLFDGARVSSILPFPAPSMAEKKAFYNNNTTRFSFSGVQIKYSVKLQDKALQLTDTGGTHILKPIPTGNFERLDQAPANEHLTMQIARQLFKIPVAMNGIVHFQDQEGIPAYITRRFDVLPGGTKNMQEDFAQLANRTEDSHGKNYKYDGSYEDAALLIKKYVAAYKPETEKFFRLVMFNFLFSNADAHLKNFSLSRSPYGDYLLSPGYDLLCTQLHNPGESDLAMENGLYDRDYESPGHGKYGHYTAMEFQTFAERIGIVPARAAAMIAAMAQKELDVLHMIGRSFLDTDSKAIYKRLYLDKKKMLFRND